MIKLRTTWLAIAVLCSSTAMAQKNELNWTMERAIDQLAQQGENFETALADVEIDWVNKDGVADKGNSGRIYFNEDGDVRIHITSPTERTVLIEGRDVHIYDPATATVHEYDRSASSRLEVFTVLGFSVTGEDLEDGYLVTFIGEDEITNRRVLGLELTPKRDSDRETVSSITLWIDEASWLPVRQIIEHTPSGQSITTTFSGTARNLSLNPDLFKDKWPRDTDKVNH